MISENIFKLKNYFFSTGTPTTNKLDGGILATYFSELQETVLKLQTNLMTVCR